MESYRIIAAQSKFTVPADPNGGIWFKAKRRCIQISPNGGLIISSQAGGKGDFQLADQIKFSIIPHTGGYFGYQFNGNPHCNGDFSTFPPTDIMEDPYLAPLKGKLVDFEMAIHKMCGGEIFCTDLWVTVM